MNAQSVYSYTVKREKTGMLRDIGGPLDSSECAAAFLHAIGLNDEEQEHFVTLLLDTKNHIRGYAPVTVGLVDYCPAHPREVFRAAVILGATKVMVAHNHPSGDPTPSRDDIEMTRQLVEAGKVMGIELLDHVIVAGDRHSSLRDRGVIT